MQLGFPRTTASTSRKALLLLQLRILLLRFCQDANVRVGVLPERKEILIVGQCPSAGSIGIGALQSSRLQGMAAGHAQTRQRARPPVPDDAAVVENLLKLCGRFTPLSGCQVLPTIGNGKTAFRP